ncbi:hypothetical protein NKG94_00805 [Micromonospora sp. M12]
MAGDAALARRAGERWVSAGLARLQSQIDHYIRQSWCWARAHIGDDPAGAAAEAEALLAANLLDPPQWGIAYHHGLIAEMWLAAGLPDRAEAALDRADQAVWEHGQRYGEGLLLLLRARLSQARGTPRGGPRRSRTSLGPPPPAGPGSSPDAPNDSSPNSPSRRSTTRRSTDSSVGVKCARST